MSFILYTDIIGVTIVSYLLSTGLPINREKHRKKVDRNNIKKSY